MSLERAILDRIKADSALFALVGNRQIAVSMTAANANVELPYILIQQITAVPYYTMLSDSKVHQTRYQFEFYSTVFQSLLTARDRFIQIFSGFRGNLAPVAAPYGLVNVQRLHMVDQRIDSQQPTDGSQIFVYRLSQDWEIDYNVSVPA